MNIWNYIHRKTVDSGRSDPGNEARAALGALKEHVPLDGDASQLFLKELSRSEVREALDIFLTARKEWKETNDNAGALLAAARQLEDVSSQDNRKRWTKVVDQLTGHSRTLSRFFDQKADDELKEDIAFIPESKIEAYYFEEGFRPLEGSTELWVKKTEDEETTGTRIFLARPGVDEYSVHISLELSGEDVNQKLFLLGASAEEKKALDGVQECFAERALEMRERLLRKLTHYSPSLKYERDPTDEGRLNRIYRSIESRIKEETDLDTLLSLRPFFDQVLPAAAYVRAQWVDGFPVTADDACIAEVSAALRELQEALDGKSDELMILSSDLSREMVMKFILHPNAKKAFDAGMDLADVVKYNESLSKTNDVVGKLFDHIRAVRVQSTQSKEIEIRALNRLLELQDKVTEGSEILEKESAFFDAVNQLVVDTINLSVRKGDLETALNDLVRVNPLSTRFQEIVSGYAAENAAFKSAFTKLAYEILDAHKLIHESLRATGKLPANIVEREQSIGRLLGEVIGTIQLETADDEELIAFQLFNAESNQGLTSLSIVRNVQIFSDTADIKGFSVASYLKEIAETDWESFTEGGHKINRFYARRVPYENPDDVRSSIGYYIEQMDVGDNKQVLGKADWNAEITEQDEEGKPTFKKGSVTIGKAFYDVQNNEWGPIREVVVPLDLSALSLSKKQTEAYFDLFELTGNDYNKIKGHYYGEESGRLNDLFSEDEWRQISLHFYRFSQDVYRALYITQYAILHPEESYEKHGVIDRDPPFDTT